MDAVFGGDMIVLQGPAVISQNNSLLSLTQSIQFDTIVSFSSELRHEIIMNVRKPVKIDI